MRKLLVTLTAFLLFAGGLLAQKTVTGKVTDDKGNPIPNASVMVKGTTTGTVTKADGSFSLTVPSNGKALIVSAVDMATQEKAIGEQTSLDFSLAQEDKTISEVVVVGYGTQQKKAFTGSASKVDVKEFANLMTPSVDKQLAGRAAGVQVTNSGGLVNAPARIRVRGTASLSQGNEPLIVVDGIPIISGNLAGATNSNTLGDINPADIESMEVLKDGSATAIYGSRAAAGVIIITTKKGGKGRARVNYESYVGFSSVLKNFDVLNASEFVTIANEKRSNAGQSLLANTNPSLDTARTDWQREVMIKNATAQNHNLSVQGGTDKTSYYFSLNYSDQKGVIISNYNKSIRIRMNVEHEINKFLKVGNNVALSRQEDGDQNNGTNALGGAIASTIRQLPNVSPYSSTHFSGYNINYPNTSAMTPGPNAQTIDDNFSNVAFTLRNNKFYSDKYRIINSSFLELSPANGFKFRSQFNVDMFNDYSYSGLSPLHGDGYGTPTGGTNGAITNSTQNRLRFVFTNYFNYNLKVKAHSFFLTGGHEVQKTTIKNFSASGTNISDAYFIKENYITNTASIQSITGGYVIESFESLFARFNYDYKNKYFVQATVRRDGQSALAEGKKYGTFPGFSVGWRVSEEGFWKNSPGLANAVNEFKIKASYAKVGNTLGGFPYLSTFGSAPYGNLSGIAPNRVGNPDLVWETSAKYDVGIELGILRNRFTLTADWFLNDIDNLVFDVPTPPSAGIPGNFITQNIATMQNRGIELSISGNILTKKNFSWDINVNYSSVKNKITSLYPVGGVPVQFVESGAYNRLIVGQPINVIFGYNYAGVNTANGNPMWYKADGSLVQLSLTPGSTLGSMYVATKDVAALGALSSLTANDKIALGQGVPTWFGAFTNTFKFMGFDLDVMFRYSGGNKIMNVTRQEALFNMKFQNNGREILQRWTAAGQVTDVPKIYYGQDNNINRNGEANSRFVEDGKYLRLQNVVLSYNLPSSKLDSWTNGIIRNARFFVQGQNLYVWTKYKGADPDNISAAGVDFAVAPQVRTISVGLSIGL